MDILRRLQKRGFHLDAFFTFASLIALGVIVLFPFPGEPAALGLGQPELYMTEEAPPSPEKNIVTFATYKVVQGDTISGIASRFGLNQDSIISCNEIEKARQLQIGMVLQIPSMNGLMHTVKKGDSLEKISTQYDVPKELIEEVNTTRPIPGIVGGKVFIPEARLPSIELLRVWGELFRYPTRGWISSPYGYRNDPITGKKRFHNGIDIANSTGTTVRAAMDGRVSDTGYNESAGNYIIIGHIGGYRTFYAHLSRIDVKPGMTVSEGRKIGEIGNTGYSTGDHLHFSIFRWGRPVNPSLLLH